MIAKAQVQLGKKYEVKPETFHRSLVGTAEKITEAGIVFKIEYCDICDREKAAANDLQVLANDVDIKQPINEQCFFS